MRIAEFVVHILRSPNKHRKIRMVMGDRGMSKTTAIRVLADLLPEIKTKVL